MKAKMNRICGIFVNGVENGKEFDRIEINYRNGNYHTMWFLKNGKVVIRMYNFQDGFKETLEKWATNENAEICVAVSTVEI